MARSGNEVYKNLGLNPAVNFNFMLRVEGIIDLPCKAVHAFQRENEYELIQEGGLNDYVHMRRKPISKPFTFQVERYVGVDITDPLANGTELVLPLILYINRNVVWNDFTPVRMYVFTGCTVMSKQYGELNAEKGGLLVETTTIAYREMVCMENVISFQQDGDLWEFQHFQPKTAEELALMTAEEREKYNLSLREYQREGYMGTGSRSARRNSGEKRKSEMAAEAEKHQWKFNKEKPKILSEEALAAMDEKERAAYYQSLQTRYRGVTRSAKTNNTELLKAEMQEAGRRWPETSSAKTNPGELKKKDMQDVGRKWPETASAQKRKTDDKIKAEEPRIWSFMEEKSAEEIAAMNDAERTAYYQSLTKKYLGTGTQSAKTVPGEKRKDAMQAAGLGWPEKSFAKKRPGVETEGEGSEPRIWSFMEEETDEALAAMSEEERTAYYQSLTKRYMGTGTRSAKTTPGEKRKSAMQAAGRVWPETSSAKKREGVELPGEGESDRIWEMEGTDMNGSGERSAVHPKGEQRKAAMEREAKRNLWQFDTKSGSMNGLGRQSAVHPDDELRKRKMNQIAAGRRWPEMRSAVDVASFLANKNKKK